jgi:hypothetical protein
MTSLALRPNAAGTGSIAIATPVTSATTTITLPDVTGGEFIVSNASGNVGIGTTSPAFKLDVNGTIAVGGLATKQILAVHTASDGTTYTRTSTTAGAWGAVLTITPVSAASRFLILASSSGYTQQSGGDNDNTGYLDACVRNSDGSYTPFLPTTNLNIGALNIGTNGIVYGAITSIFDTDARYVGDLVVGTYGNAGADGTASQVTTLGVYQLSVIAVEYI